MNKNLRFPSILLLSFGALAFAQIHPTPPAAKDYTASKDASGTDTNAVGDLKKGYTIQCIKGVGQNDSPAVCHVVLQPSGQTQDLRARPDFQTMGVGDNDTMILTCVGTAPTSCTARVHFRKS